MRLSNDGYWMHGVFCALLIVGGFTTYDPGPTGVELREQERCTPLVRQADTDGEAWELLQRQGYDDRAGSLYPPGCEIV